MTGPRKIDDAFLSDIARQYREHVAAGVKPGPAIAAKEGAPVRTVHRWIYEARKRGLLAPGTPPGLCGGTVLRNSVGQAGQNVRSNIRQLRATHRLSTTRLSEALKEIGQPISPSGITRVELGERRVNVDELVALAAALRVTPTFLLDQPSECQTCHGAPPLGFACTDCGARSSK